MAQFEQFIHSLATANPQQQEQLLQQVPLQRRAEVLLRAQQIRQQQQQQQQQQQGNPGGGGMIGVQLRTGPVGSQQPGSHLAQQQQRQARPMVVWSGIMELTEVVNFDL